METWGVCNAKGDVCEEQREKLVDKNGDKSFTLRGLDIFATAIHGSNRCLYLGPTLGLRDVHLGPLFYKRCGSQILCVHSAPQCAAKMKKMVHK